MRAKVMTPVITGASLAAENKVQQTTPHLFIITVHVSVFDRELMERTGLQV